MSRKTIAVVAMFLLLCGVPVFSANSATNSAVTVGVARTRLGPILVDGTGHTLYLLTLDRKRSSSCTNLASFNCVAGWPPLLTIGKPHAGPGVNPALLGTMHRTKPSGVQVTYNGHPLYRNVQDTAPGDVKGQGGFGTWYVVSPKGTPVKRK